MNKLIEGIKDIVHDSIDVILVIVIFLAVGGTILWRLDILFATDMDRSAIDQPSDTDVATGDDSINSPSDPGDNSSPTDDSSSDQNPDDSETTDDSENNPNDNEGSGNNNSDGSNNTDEETSDNEINNDEPIIVVIPNGSLAPRIRDIVYELGLIQLEERDTFLLRAQELKLDTKFQSGTFKIERGASLDTIIKTIARAL